MTYRVNTNWMVAACTAALVLGATSARAQVRYRIIDLTELAPVVQSEATSINERGEIVGWEALPDFQAQAVYWDAAHNGHLLERLSGDNSNIAATLNESGVISGTSDFVRIKHVGHQIRIFQDQKASIWQNGVITNLNTTVTGGADLNLRVAEYINDQGQIVGSATPPGETMRHGFLLENGMVTDLGTLNTGQFASVPTAINGQGQIAGYASFGQDKAFLWESGVLTNLHEHPLITGVTSRAYDINNAGQIVGEAQFHISQPESPVLWQNGEPVNLVGHRFGRPQGVASAINDRGQIIGWVNDLDNLNDETRGFLIDGEEFIELIDHIPAGQGWNQLILAWDINEKGWIVGGGRRFGQVGHAFLLIPIDTPGDMNCDGVFNGGDIDPFFLALGDPAAYLATFPDCRIANGDMNGDGALNGGDIDPFFACLGGGVCP